jgi:hypothetical protein
VVVVEVVIGEAGVIVMAELAADVETETGAAVVGGKEGFEQVFLGVGFEGRAGVFKVNAVVVDADGETAALAVTQGVAAQIPTDLMQVFGIKMDGFVMGTNNMDFLGFAQILGDEFLFEFFQHGKKIEFLGICGGASGHGQNVFNNVIGAFSLVGDNVGDLAVFIE